VPTAPPPLTIGLPVFNGLEFLPATLDSILGQSFGDFALIVSDNASTDSTDDLVRDYAARDRRVRLHRREHNLGAAHNYNEVFALSASPHFKWAGHDDLLLPGYLEQCMETITTAPADVAICYPKTRLIDLDGNAIDDFEDRLDLRSPDPIERLIHFTWNVNLCNPCFGVIRSEMLARTRLVEPYVSSDVPLLADLALQGQFWELPDRLFARRIHDRSSRQGKLTLAQTAQWFDTRRRRAPIIPVRVRLFAEIEAVIARSDLPPPERRRAEIAFARAWTERRARVRGGRLKAAARSWLDRSPGLTTRTG
jgi:glycosyltransferase involved in cell wall biosynthesis